MTSIRNESNKDKIPHIEKLIEEETFISWFKDFLNFGYKNEYKWIYEGITTDLIIDAANSLNESNKSKMFELIQDLIIIYIHDIDGSPEYVKNLLNIMNPFNNEFSEELYDLRRLVETKDISFVDEIVSDSSSKTIPKSHLKHILSLLNSLNFTLSPEYWKNLLNRIKSQENSYTEISEDLKAFLPLIFEGTVIAGNIYFIKNIFEDIPNNSEISYHVTFMINRNLRKIHKKNQDLGIKTALYTSSILAIFRNKNEFIEYDHRLSETLVSILGPSNELMYLRLFEKLERIEKQKG